MSTHLLVRRKTKGGTLSEPRPYCWGDPPHWDGSVVDRYLRDDREYPAVSGIDLVDCRKCRESDAWLEIASRAPVSQ